MELVTLILTWLVSSLPHTTRADYEKVCSPDQAYNPSRFLCGGQLASVLRSLCKDGYHYHNKRTGDTGVGGRLLKDASVPEEHGKVFLPKTKASAYLHQKRTSIFDGQAVYRQGIVCECCYHRCSVLELIQYCAAGADGRRTHIFSKKSGGSGHAPGKDPTLVNLLEGQTLLEVGDESAEQGKESEEYQRQAMATGNDETTKKRQAIDDMELKERDNHNTNEKNDFIRFSDELKWVAAREKR